MVKKTKPDVSVSLPKSKAAQEKIAQAMKHAHYTFPTLTLRQAHILLDCMKLGMDAGITVDGRWVTGEEWVELVKTLINVQ